MTEVYITGNTEWKWVWLPENWDARLDEVHALRDDGWLWVPCGGNKDLTLGLERHRLFRRKIEGG